MLDKDLLWCIVALRPFRGTMRLVYDLPIDDRVRARKLLSSFEEDGRIEPAEQGMVVPLSAIHVNEDRAVFHVVVSRVYEMDEADSRRLASWLDMAP